MQVLRPWAQVCLTFLPYAKLDAAICMLIKRRWPVCSEQGLRASITGFSHVACVINASSAWLRCSLLHELINSKWQKGPVQQLVSFGARHTTAGQRY